MYVHGIHTAGPIISSALDTAVHTAPAVLYTTCPVYMYMCVYL